MNTLQKHAQNLRSEPLSKTVKRLGIPASALLLDAQFSIFSTPETEGIIGYKIFKNCALVIGDPICLPQNTEKLTQAFRQFCADKNLKISYFLASKEFAYWAINHGCQCLIQAGEASIVDPTAFKPKQKLKWKIKQSIQNGVSVKEFTPSDSDLEHQFAQTIKKWKNAKKGPQLYLGDLNFFNHGEDRRIFYSVQNEKLVGILKLTPLDRFKGWVVNCYLAIPDAPVGTTEHLICSVFETLAKEECRFLCLGVICGSSPGEMMGLNYFAKMFARLIFKISKWVFRLEEKKTYLNKYHPHYLPTYIVFEDTLTFTELMALKHILNVKL